jgi:hypothetical protein
MAAILFAAAPAVDDPSGGQNDAFGGLCEATHKHSSRSMNALI